MGGLRHGGYFFLNWLTVLLTTLVAQSFGEWALPALRWASLAGGPWRCGWLQQRQLRPAAPGIAPNVP